MIFDFEKDFEILNLLHRISVLKVVVDDEPSSYETILREALEDYFDDLVFLQQFKQEIETGNYT